ncbi:hypothetical protein [Streptomyces canus]|uniref:hypothetical protein n=1 Tax=Streptomyces canus TaxID=58343 RepID=UPI00381139FB
MRHLRPLLAGAAVVADIGPRAAAIGNVDKLPAGAIRVTITDVQKRTHSDLPS